jgi:hypothetical protein
MFSGHYTLECVLDMYLALTTPVNAAGGAQHGFVGALVFGLALDLLFHAGAASRLYGVWGATEQLWNAFHNAPVAPQHPRITIVRDISSSESAWKL